MKNKSIIVFYTLCALIPIIFIAVAFFGPEKEVPISLQGPNTFGFDDEKITKKYDELEKKEKKKREKFKKEVEKKWDSFKESTSKTYVTYSKDLNSRTIVDFEKGEVTIEVIMDEDEGQNGSYNLDLDKRGHIQIAGKNNLRKIILSISTSLVNKAITFVLQEKEEQDNLAGSKDSKALDSKFAKLLSNIFKEKGDDGQPILKDQLVDARGKAVKGMSNTLNFAKTVVGTQSKKVRMHFSKDGKKRTIISLKLPLSDDHIAKRRDRYKDLIVIEARRFNIPPEIALAIAETESAFNPKAKSHVPAYGLMQLVPKTGARDAYQWIYKKDKHISGKYLFKPKNNVELGCAYLSMIRHHYFSGIRDDELAYICAIPAYNTGVGNVSKALVDQTNIRKASKKANKMDADELYDKLYTDLGSKEAKNYLKKVWTRKENYK